MSHEYAFDVKLNGAVRIIADSEAEAREQLDRILDESTANLGEMANGDPLLGEVSLATEPSEMHLFQVDGVDVELEPVSRDDLLTMLEANLEAWEGEEDSVKKEHADLINDTTALLERARKEKPRGVCPHEDCCLRAGHDGDHDNIPF